MKKIVSIVCVLIALTVASCNKCKNPEHVPRAKLMDEYFGSYKPGAYWIYLNKDSTKRDSLWVDDYNVRTLTDEHPNCLSMEFETYTLNSSYLEPSTKLNIELGSYSPDLKSTTFYTAYDANGNGYTTFYSSNDSAKFYYNDIAFDTLHNYKLWENQSLPVVTKIGTLIFAPNLGLVQYMPLHLQDTFSLIKFNVK